MLQAPGHDHGNFDYMEKSGALKHHLLHKAAQVNNAAQVEMTDRRQIFVYSGSGQKGSPSHLYKTYTAGLAQRGIDGNDQGPRLITFDPFSVIIARPDSPKYFLIGCLYATRISANSYFFKSS